MGRNQRLRKLRRIQAQEEQKGRTPTWSERVSCWPAWAKFLYRFLIASAILLPVFLVGFWVIKSQMEKSGSEKSATITATIKTDFGDIKVSLFQNDAPKTVDNFVRLAKKKYYNGLVFHRVVRDFVIQTGDPNCSDSSEATACGSGGESAWGGKFADEINAQSLGLSAADISTLEKQGYTYRTDLKSHKVEVGSLAMANSGANTNGSQFFIVTTKAQPHLNGRHTVFGQVIDGMNVVSAIAAVETDENDRPLEDVKIKSIIIHD